jgi:hypothetical protein
MPVVLAVDHDEGWRPDEGWRKVGGEGQAGHRIGGRKGLEGRMLEFLVWYLVRVKYYLESKGISLPSTGLI